MFQNKFAELLGFPQMVPQMVNNQNLRIYFVVRQLKVVSETTDANQLYENYLKTETSNSFLSKVDEEDVDEYDAGARIYETDDDNYETYKSKVDEYYLKSNHLL